MEMSVIVFDFGIPAFRQSRVKPLYIQGAKLEINKGRSKLYKKCIKNIRRKLKIEVKHVCISNTYEILDQKKYKELPYFSGAKWCFRLLQFG